MYTRETILVLKQQRDPDPETNEEFPYNRVKVVGPSPINHGGKVGDNPWTGPEGAGVIITPLTNFGSTLDEPYGKLKALYDVESIPEPAVVGETKIRVVESTSQDAGPTPEEVFAEKAPGTPPEEGQRRGRTSPLEDPRPTDTSPLTSPLEAPVPPQQQPPAPPTTVID